jgi:hypothetical protein
MQESELAERVELTVRNGLHSLGIKTRGNFQEVPMETGQELQFQSAVASLCSTSAAAKQKRGAPANRCTPGDATVGSVS